MFQCPTKQLTALLKVSHNVNPTRAKDGAPLGDSEMNRSDYYRIRHMARIEKSHRETTQFPCYPVLLTEQIAVYAQLINIVANRETIDRIIGSISPR